MTLKYNKCLNSNPNFMKAYKSIKGSGKEKYIKLTKLAHVMQKKDPKLRTVFRSMDKDRKRARRMVEVIAYYDHHIKEKGNFKKLLITAALAGHKLL